MAKMRIKREKIERREGFALFARVMEQGPDPVVVTDVSGRIEYVNQRFSEVTGYPKEEVLGKNPRILSAGETPRATYDQLWETILSGKIWQGELYNRKKSGESFWEFITIAPIRDEGGRISNFAASWKDISGKKQIEEKLAKIAAELERSNLELEQFAYVASHDLQEPLSMVQMYLDLLEMNYSDKLDEPGRELIRNTKAGAQHSQKLIRGLLDYARIGIRERSLETTDFEALLRRVMTDLEMNVLKSGADITHDKLPKTAAEPFLMGRLFQNLLSNAIKYRSGEPLKIHISARREKTAWIFSIRDNGIGIASKDKERAFGLFQRLHTETEHPGTGIGLALCKKIVERHGGKIWLESEPGQGTTFHFSLPEQVKKTGSLTNS